MNELMDMLKDGFIKAISEYVVQGKIKPFGHIKQLHTHILDWMESVVPSVVIDADIPANELGIFSRGMLYYREKVMNTLREERQKGEGIMNDKCGACGGIKVFLNTSILSKDDISVCPNCYGKSDTVFHPKLKNRKE